MPSAVLSVVLSAVLSVVLWAILGCAEAESVSGDASVVDAGSSVDAGGCPVSCASFDLGQTSYDSASHRLEVTLLASSARVRAGSITFQVGKRGGGLNSHSAVLSVSDRALFIDLSTWMTQDVVFFGGISLTLVAECGATSSVGDLVPEVESGSSPLAVRAFHCGS